MASTPTPSAPKGLSIPRSRPNASTIQSPNPHTPLSRQVSNLYGSPGSSFRIDDENLLIFEFGSRRLRAGFAGESSPRCDIAYSPELWRRTGDYRQWEAGYGSRRRKRKRGEDWGAEYELWKCDLRELEMGVVEDRVEKLVREAEGKYLLLDNRGKRVALAAPSYLPRPLLNVVLRGLFERLQAASVTILPSSIMSAVGAGVRSALVVDIGWEEAIVSAVYEYREVHQSRSVRAGKMLSQELGKVLNLELAKKPASKGEKLNFEEVEEVMCRMAWCQDKNSARSNSNTESTNISIPLPKSPSTPTLDIPFSTLALPVEIALFANNVAPQNLDDHDLPLHHLLYNALLALPLDIRHLCLTSLIITGGTSSLPGLKARLLSELTHLISTRGWDPIRTYGHYTRRPLGETHGNTTNTSASPNNLNSPILKSVPENEDENEPPIPAHAKPHDTNPIDTKFANLSLSNTTIPGIEKGTPRILTTLGPWAGASLLTNLRIKGAVEIERERFMSHGLVGGAVKREGVVVEAKGRQSLGGGKALGAAVVGGAAGWSLGIWG